MKNENIKDATIIFLFATIVVLVLTIVFMQSRINCLNETINESFELTETAIGQTREAVDLANFWRSENFDMMDRERECRKQLSEAKKQAEEVKEK